MIARYQRIRESYEILGVDVGAPFDTVRDRYRKLIKRWHPDVAAASVDEAEEQAKKINEALTWIKSLSPTEIAAAQRHFRAGSRPSPGTAQAPGAAHWPKSSSAGSSRRKTATFRGRRGRDIFSRVRITPSQAAAGSRWSFLVATCRHCAGWGAAMDGEFQMCASCCGLGLYLRPDGSFDLEALCLSCGGNGCAYTRRCASCVGSGERIHYAVRCHIPPLTAESAFGVLRGQGHRGFGGGAPGDLYLRISTGH